MIILTDLAEFRRQEKETPDLQQPPANFLQDLKEYMARVQEEAGPHPAGWDMECEAIAAMDLLDDIFRIRRAKLAQAAEHDAQLPVSHMFTFESCAWSGITRKFRLLDEAIKEMVHKGEWSGKWGQP
jgi:hypothetical protein